MNINMAGQTINDRLLAARHSLAGQGLAKSVCKATTEEMIGPKKKHLDCKCCLCLSFFASARSKTLRKCSRQQNNVLGHCVKRAFNLATPKQVKFVCLL